MKKVPCRLPDSELDIMLVLWHNKPPMSRLEKKSFVAVTKEGKNNLYTPLVSEQDYQQKESHSMLERLYGNSLKSFVNSLYQGKHMDQGDIRELSDFLKEMEQNLEEH